MNDRPLLSATQIDMWRNCQRQWGFKYLDRVQLPPDPSLELGKIVQDQQIDPWLEHGREFDFGLIFDKRNTGEIAAKLRDLLPPPKSPGLKLRRKFVAMPSPSGRFDYQGEFDIWAADSGIVPGIVGGRPLLGDIKTTGNLKYAKTPDKLATDIQFILYATDILVEDGADEFDGIWWYTRTKGAYKAERWHLRVGGDRAKDGFWGDRVTTGHVVEQFGQIDRDGCELVTTKLQAPKANELPPNVRMCDQYGGCKYRHLCNLSPAVQAAAVNEEAIKMSNPFMANLRQQLGQPPAQSPSVAPAQTFAPPAPPMAPAEVAAQPPPATALPPWATAPVDPLATRQAPPPGVLPANPNPPRVALPVAINPPESQLPPAPPVGAPAPNLSGQPQASPLNGPSMQGAINTAIAAGTPEPPKKRGRPVGSKNAPATPGATFGGADLADVFELPRAEFAAFLRTWAAKVEGGP